MKILILVNALVPGGAERQAVRDANILLAKGHEVFVCCGRDGPLRSQLDSGVRLFDLQTRSQLKAVPKLAGFIRGNNIEIVLSHMFWANKVASAACFFTGRKNIAFEHGLGLWRKWHHLFLVRLVARQATAIVTCSEAGKKIRISRDRVPRHKVRVIHNSFAVPYPIQENEPVQNDSQSSILNIGFAGRFNKVKQLHLLVDVALHLIKSTRDFRFILLGDGAEKRVIEDIVRVKNLAKQFQFTGYVQDPMAYLRRMDCFVLPSRREDFSLALLEASYCGLPCIAFDVGGNREIISDGNTGWVVEPDDVAGMAEKILQLKYNPEQLKKMKTAAKQRVQNLFSQKQRGQNLMQLIQATVG